jgi:hypothetical protein
LQVSDLFEGLSMTLEKYYAWDIRHSKNVTLANADTIPKQFDPMPTFPLVIQWHQ